MQHANILSIAGLRIDGRRFNELRRIQMRIGVSRSSDGSSYLEQGLNKVFVAIYGPHEPSRRSADSTFEKGDLKVSLITSSCSGSEYRKRRVGDNRTQEMESTIEQTLKAVVLLELYPRSEINIIVHVFESDGSLLCTILNAISIAMVDAGIAMTDLLVSCSAGFVLNNLCQDLNQLEQSSEGAYLPVAIKGRSEEVLFLQLNNRISMDNLDAVLSEAIDGCKKIHSLIEKELKTNMLSCNV